MDTAKSLKVGFQNRKDTFTGKLGFIISDDENKPIDTTAFKRWCDANLGFMNIENKYETGFLINKNINRQSTFSNSKNIRVFHPKGFEFEVAVENLIYLIANANIVSQEIMAPCLVCWSRGKIFLVPKGTPEALKMDKIIGGSYDYEVKKVYRVKNKHLAYMGAYKFRQISGGFENVKHSKTNYSGINALSLNSNDRYVLSSWSNKEVHVFYDIEEKKYLDFVNFPAKDAVDPDFSMVNLSQDEVDGAFVNLSGFAKLAKAEKIVGIVRNPNSLAQKVLSAMNSSDTYLNSVEGFVKFLEESVPLFDKLKNTKLHGNCFEQELITPVFGVGKKDGTVKFTYKKLSGEDIVIPKSAIAEIVAEPSMENKILMLTNLLTLPTGRNLFFGSSILIKVNGKNYGVNSSGGIAKLWESPDFYCKLQKIENNLHVFEDYNTIS